MSEPTPHAATETVSDSAPPPRTEHPHESRHEFSLRRVREVREAAGGIFDIGDSGGH